MFQLESFWTKIPGDGFWQHYVARDLESYGRVTPIFFLGDTVRSRTSGEIGIVSGNVLRETCDHHCFVYSFLYFVKFGSGERLCSDFNVQLFYVKPMTPELLELKKQARMEYEHRKRLGKNAFN